MKGEWRTYRYSSRKKRTWQDTPTHVRFSTSVSRHSRLATSNPLWSALWTSRSPQKYGVPWMLTLRGRQSLRNLVFLSDRQSWGNPSFLAPPSNRTKRLTRRNTYLENLEYPASHSTWFSTQQPRLNPTIVHSFPPSCRRIIASRWVANPFLLSTHRRNERPHTLPHVPQIVAVVKVGVHGHLTSLLLRWNDEHATMTHTTKRILRLGESTTQIEQRALVGVLPVHCGPHRGAPMHHRVTGKIHVVSLVLNVSREEQQWRLRTASAMT